MYPTIVQIKHSIQRLAAFSLLALVVMACGEKNGEPSPADNSKDRRVILTFWADSVVVPAYANFQAVFNIMLDKTDAFTASPDETNLAALREAWADAYGEWQNVEMFEFGPADKYTLRNFFNIYPTDVNGIISNMNNAAANLDLPAAYATQGFPALDYLINGVGADDAAIVVAYTSDPDAPKRLAYLERITARMKTLLENVVTEWSGTYRDTFIDRTGLDIGSSMGIVVNAYVLHYERYIRSGKIGIPSGAQTGSFGTPYPEKVEAFYKKNISQALAKEAHRAARDFFNGTNLVTGSTGPSLKSYLDALGAKDAASGTLLSEIINNQFDAITVEINDLSPNLYEQIQNDNQKMYDTYAAMQALVRMLKVDMTSAMSITITYTDNDGD